MVTKKGWNTYVLIAKIEATSLLHKCLPLQIRYKLLIKIKTKSFTIHTSARNIAESTTEKKGSMALMVWVNDTATFPRLILVKRLPKVCTTAKGRIATS